jgi:hypothetical protein
MWKALVVLVALIVGGILSGSTRAKLRPGHRDHRTGRHRPHGEVSVSVVTPKGALKRLEVVLAQDATTVPVFMLTQTNASELTVAGDRVSITRPSGKNVVPELKQGNAEIRVTAVRPSSSGSARRPRRRSAASRYGSCRRRSPSCRRSTT